MDVLVVPLPDNLPQFLLSGKSLDIRLREAPPQAVGLEGDPQDGLTGQVELPDLADVPSTV